MCYVLDLLFSMENIMDLLLSVENIMDLLYSLENNFVLNVLFPGPLV
jgi:hypothetical protein